jgi:flagellar biosynthesis/type III secretory pathway chaperone
MLLQKLWHARQNEKQVKMHNGHLIERNMELHDRSKEILEKYKKTVEKEESTLI